MQQQILSSNKKCSVGFIFRYLPWAIALRHNLLNSLIMKKEVWRMKWCFMAHHYKNELFGWKREHDQGGGVIRFYGIHVIALLAEWGYEQVGLSEVVLDPKDGNFYKWRAIFKGPDLADFEVEIDTRSEDTYLILQNNKSEKPFYLSKDPFGGVLSEESHLNIDPRGDYLKNVLTDNISQTEIWPTRLSNSIKLWDLVEGSTKNLLDVGINNPL
jgi:hypothetical protein